MSARRARGLEQRCDLVSCLQGSSARTGSPVGVHRSDRPCSHRGRNLRSWGSRRSLCRAQARRSPAVLIGDFGRKHFSIIREPPTLFVNPHRAHPGMSKGALAHRLFNHAPRSNPPGNLFRMSMSATNRGFRIRIEA